MCKGNRRNNTLQILSEVSILLHYGYNYGLEQRHSPLLLRLISPLQPYAYETVLQINRKRLQPRQVVVLVDQRRVRRKKAGKLLPVVLDLARHVQLGLQVGIGGLQLGVREGGRKYRQH